MRVLSLAVATMISHEHKCIFIHIPKTGGTSIEVKMAIPEEKTLRDHRSIREIEPLTLGHAARLHHPDHLRLMLKRLNHARHRRSTVTREQYESYFKFTIVRNPWARVVSWYKNVMRDERHQRRLGVPKDCPFGAFVRNHPRQCALRPQDFWITDDRGEMPLDFVGRFERLNDEFAHVCDRLGIRDRDLPKVMTGDERPYAQFYDDETRELIAQRYAREIALWGFEFAG